MSSVEEIRASRPREPEYARVALIMVVAGAFGVVKGRHGGRVLTTVALCVACFFLVPYCWEGFSAPVSYGPAFAVMDVVALLLSLVALHWLYHPSTSRYIHLVTVARQAG